MLNRAELKQEAKAVNRSACVSPYVFALIFLVITVILKGLDAYVSGDAVTYMQKNVPWMTIPAFLTQASFPPTVTAFASVVVGLLGFVLGAGWNLYLLGVRRGERMEYSTLFDGFSFAGKLIALNVVMIIFITLWSMLLVIPGIVAAYRYRFAVLNLCENPELGVMEALNMSKAQTSGYKGQLFALDLSFLGWVILCSLTMGILSIWVLPYFGQTNVGYFQEIKRVKGIGYFPESRSDEFHRWDSFDPER